MPVGELSRLCRDLLRASLDEIMSADEIAVQVMTTKGFDTNDRTLRAAIRRQVGSALRNLAKRRTVERIQDRRSVTWKLAARL
jgi:hypothetical protein